MLPCVAVLFARRDSIYKQLPARLDVYDEDRDARTFAGGCPVVAHPPCRAWGRLRHFARPAMHEKDLAFFAVDQVRRCGGVLEHPEASSLWPVAGLPRPGERDEFGGFTLPIHQFWWGHRARKSTWLYIVGVGPSDIPAFPLVLGQAPCVVDTVKRAGDPGRRPLLKDAEREATPIDLAVWLVDLAHSCRRAA